MTIREKIMETMRRETWYDSVEDAADIAEAEVARLEARIRFLEDLLIEHGAIEDAPCFICGYDGPGYYQPDKHQCAERHHKLRAGGE